MKRSVYVNFLLKLKLMKIQTLTMGPEDVLEEIFSDRESFRERDTESVEDGDSGNEDEDDSEWLTNTYAVTDVLFHDISGCFGHNGADTSTTILSLPSPSNPVADEQMDKVRAVLENYSSTTTSLIEYFSKTAASQDILEEISPLPSSSNKERKRKRSAQVKRPKLITHRASKEDLKMKAKMELKSEEENYFWFHIKSDSLHHLR
ncbi:hypothetical protein AVEN_88410-1 [Araneus ventricosus]|uniref:Uncharacterized protein n=1 Tax=Araneus ventricosus TaxID=182803 RepID=A0A4Y2PPP6_ARAVE|nr:hypothetical protein AVEN_88410-1 [Araneus ventricosus]